MANSAHRQHATPSFAGVEPAAAVTYIDEPRPSCRAAIRRRGLVLVVVLVMVVLLALLSAGYTLMVRAHLGAALIEHQQFQARMAAESGVQFAVSVLRESRADPGVWYNNPEIFRGVLVEGTAGEAVVEQQADRRTYDRNAPAAWRFHLVASNYEDPTTIRYGITDETSRIDLNRVTEPQLRRVFEQTIPQDATNQVDINVLVDSLLDWREPGDAPRPNGAKDEYYETLDPPYRAKKGPFATIEELLLVRGFSGWVVFGEDYNRNGLLDPNEDDGDETFPPDNGDGVLFAGVAPLFTIWSQELNVSADRRPRINLNMRDTQELQELLSEQFPGDIVSYVMEVRGAGVAFNSVMNLFPAPPAPPAPEGSEPPTSQPDGFDASTSQPTTQSGDGNDGGLSGGLSDLNQPAPSENAPTSQPTSQPVYRDLTDAVPPATYEDLPLILDRLTVDPVPVFSGRINVTTAPREALYALDVLTPDEVEAIFEARRELTPDERMTPAWLMQRGVIEEYQFRRILPRLALNPSVFRVESVGYADHVGVVDRINVVFEMRGPIPQVLYKRNLDALGVAYNPYGEETRGIVERSR